MSDYAVILAARMGSERLPGKALAVYCPDGTPNLAQIIARWQSSRRRPCVVVVTSDAAADAPIAALCRDLEVACYRAPAQLVAERNVLAQVDGALRRFVPRARWVARALADNPLVDIALADLRVDMLAVTGADGFMADPEEVDALTYAATTDVWSIKAWDRIVVGSQGRPDLLEHPGKWWWDNLGQGDLRYLHYPLPRQEYTRPIRTELDTLADLEFFRAVWAAFDGTGPIATLDALAWAADHPAVVALNAGVALKTQTRPQWDSRGASWRCDGCKRRFGTVSEGNLAIFCPNCGTRNRFYAVRPSRRR